MTKLQSTWRTGNSRIIVIYHRNYYSGGILAEYGGVAEILRGAARV